MKNVNFAINGLGRIGKLLFRALFDKGLSIKLVNEINGNLEINSELLIHDSIHGKWDKDIFLNKNDLKINNSIIKFSNYKNLNDIQLSDIDILIDCTGKNKNFENLRSDNYFPQIYVVAREGPPFFQKLIFCPRSDNYYLKIFFLCSRSDKYFND